MRREPHRRAGAGAAALALVTVVAGCAGQPRHSSPGASPQPQSLQADAVATEEFGLLAGGGWAQAWALWDDSGTRAISQADFVRLNTVCRPPLGTAYVIDHSTTVRPGTVRVDWHRAGTTGDNTLVYRGGKWRFVPDPASLADYRLGADRLIRERRAAGTCPQP